MTRISQQQPNPSAPWALDLYCGSGGVAAGLIAAGWNVCGVDINEQPDYPGLFVQADILTYITYQDIMAYDFVWASPPCQAYTVARTVSHAPAPELIEYTRELLASHPLTCIENVPQAPLRKDLVLDMTMFRGPDAPAYRKRIFELSFKVVNTTPYPPSRLNNLVTISLSGHGSHQSEVNNRRKVGLPDHTSEEEMAEALGLTHVVTGGKSYRRQRLTQCLPVEYGEFIGLAALMAL